MRQRSMERGDAFAQLLDAGDRERAALAEALHGRILQSLAAAAMHLSVADAADEPARTRAVLADCVRLIGESIDDVRALSYCADAPFVKDLGMGAALEAYAAAFERVHKRTFVLSGVAPECAVLKDELAAALVRGMRDASYAFAEARAIAFRASVDHEDETVSASLEADFAEDARRSGFELLAAVAAERLRSFSGATRVDVGARGAKLVMRARRMR